MAKPDIKAMIERVIEDIKNNALINTFILNVQLISRELQNENFAQWLKNEVDGYPADAVLPEHRIFSAQVKASVYIEDPFRGLLTMDYHTIPLRTLPEHIVDEITKIELRESVISIEEIINIKSEKQLVYTTSENERFYLGQVYRNSSILNAYKTFDRTNMNLVVFKFKSSLLEMFCNFNNTLFKDEINFDIMAKKNEVDSIVSSTINTGIYVASGSTANISVSTVVGGQGNHIHIINETAKELSDIVNKIENLLYEIGDVQTDVADAIFSIREELGRNTPHPKVLKTAFNGLKAIAIGVAANKITPFIDTALKMLSTLN